MGTSLKSGVHLTWVKDLSLGEGPILAVRIILLLWTLPEAGFFIDPEPEFSPDKLVHLSRMALLLSTAALPLQPVCQQASRSHME